jgi:hypothetical protein
MPPASKQRRRLLHRTLQVEGLLGTEVPWQQGICVMPWRKLLLPIELDSMWHAPQGNPTT